MIRAVSPNISLGRFYSNQDEIKIINELITLSAPEKKIPTIFLWPEGIIPDSYASEMDIYQDLFINNFSSNDFSLFSKTRNCLTKDSTVSIITALNNSSLLRK